MKKNYRLSQLAALWMFFLADSLEASPCEKIEVAYFGDSFSTDFYFHKYLVPMAVDYLSHNWMRQWGSRSFLDGLKLGLKNTSPSTKFSIRSFAAVGARVTERKDRVVLISELPRWLDGRDRDLDHCSILGIWIGHNDLDWLDQSGSDPEEKINSRLNEYQQSWDRALKLISSYHYSGKVVVFTQANHEQRTVGYKRALELHKNNPSKYPRIKTSQKLLREGSDDTLRPFTLRLAQAMDEFLTKIGTHTHSLGFSLNVSPALNQMDYTKPTILSRDAVHFHYKFLYQLGIKAGEQLAGFQLSSP